MLTSYRQPWLRLAAALALALTLAACGSGASDVPPPPPSALTANATGHFCTMNLSEHIGPKGQIHLRDNKETVWLSDVTQVFAFTLLPEEAKTITAIYVQDMARADAQGNPPDDAWIDARSAHYVIRSEFVGGMGAPDALPFADLEQARDFVARHGGEIVRFDTMPEDYVFGPQPQTPAKGPAS